MKNVKKAIYIGTALCGIAQPAFGQDDASSANEANSGGDIIVTARRQNERLQDVPVAVSVLSPATLESKGVFTPIDIQRNVPGLSVSASVSDRNNLTYTIRGQGFSYGTLFPAVVTYFNEVPITQLTAGQFFDLANVQVLRGPQGVNFGRVTDGGNVMVTPQKPTDEFGGNVAVKVGDYRLRTVNGMLNVPLVGDRVLFRGAFEIGRRKGFTKNLGTGKNLDNVAYESYRAGLVVRPTDTLENYTVVAYQRTHDNGTSVVTADLNAPALTRNLNFLGGLNDGYSIDPRGNIVPFQPGLTQATVSNLIASYQAQVDAQRTRGIRTVSYDSANFSRRKNLYVVNTTTADLSDTIQLKNVFGYVNVKDDQASTYTAVNGNFITTCHSTCAQLGGLGGGLPFNWQEQFSEELRLSGKVFGDMLTWSIGGYADKQRPGGPFENDTIVLSVLQSTNVTYATTTSRALYGSAEYDLSALLPGLKVNGGIRRTRDTVKSATTTYTRPIFFPASVIPPVPHGECTGAGCTKVSGSFNVTTWAAGISYKPEGGPLLYAKASRGYRPGGVNSSAVVGSDPSYGPEFDRSIEIGIKTDFDLGGGARLSANIAAYSDKYTDIQKLISFVDSTGSPRASTTNGPQATVKGIEFDGGLQVDGLNLSGTFAYTDAKFKRGGYVPGQMLVVNGVLQNIDPCEPANFNTIGFCPLNRFNSTPKFQYSLNASYDLPLEASIGKVTIGGNYYHQSNVALNDTSKLNPKSVQAAYGLLDVNVTWSDVMGYPADLGFFMTNVTDKTYRIATNDLMQSGSFGVLGYIYGAPRMFGFSLKYRFGSEAR